MQLCGAGELDVPLPTDMEALIEGLLQQNDLAQGSIFCSAAFQSDLQAFLRTQALPMPLLCLALSRSNILARC